MKTELLRRLSILEEKNVPQVNARILRGGMQERLHRQEAIRFRDNVRKGKIKIKKKLKSIADQEKQDLINSEFGISSFSYQSVEPLDDFHEPIMRRIRSKRGFF